MSLLERDRLIIALAAAFALAVPCLVLWPDQPSPHEVSPLTITPLPALTLALSGAAARAPLFNPDRSPAPPPLPVELVSEVPPAAPPTLVGIAVGGKRAIVLLKVASGETVRAGIGEEADGWRVVAIRPDRAAVVQGDRRETLGFDLSNKPAGGAAQGSTIMPPSPRPAFPNLTGPTDQ